MITLQEFKSLSYQEQVAMLRQATYIDKREGPNFTALLYQLGAFYIEAYKHKKYQYIYKVESFSAAAKSSLYIDKVGNLSKLVLKVGLFAEFALPPGELLAIIA